MTKLIGEALAGVDPANAEAYSKNAAASAAQLDALADELAAAAKGAPNRKIVTIHDVFAYFARDAGLDLIAVIEEAPGQAPGLGELDKLVAKVRSEKPAAIFFEPQYPADPARTLGRETGVPVYELDPFASGEAKPGAYLAAMRRNLATLKSSLGAKAP
jgi:zinc transport system substrate-binding protein